MAEYYDASQAPFSLEERVQRRVWFSLARTTTAGPGCPLILTPEV